MPGINPHDPILGRILRCATKTQATRQLERIVQAEAKKYRASAKVVRATILRDLELNAPYRGKAAVNKIHRWFGVRPDFGEMIVLASGSYSVTERGR
jgi:hypothetical protein